MVSCEGSSAGPAESFAVSVAAGIESSPSSATVAESSTATGASLTAFTVIVNVAGVEEPFAFVALNVKLSEPLKSGAGVYVRFAPVPDSVPWNGPDAIPNVTDGVLFAASSVNVVDVSSFVLPD